MENIKFMFQWIMTQSTILEDISLVESVISKIWQQNCENPTLGHEILVISLYFLKCSNLQTKFPLEI